MQPFLSAGLQRKIPYAVISLVIKADNSGKYPTLFISGSHFAV